MELFDQALLKLHITAGFISLLSFIVPMVLRKGSKWHRKSGKVYVFAMWNVVLSAFLLSIINFIQQKYLPGIFLGYLGLITSSPLWYGIAILKTNKSVSNKYLYIRKYFELIIFILAIVLLGMFGIMEKSAQTFLLLIFGLLGLTSGKMAFKSIENLRNGTNRIADHVEGMLTSAIAAYTAFFVFGGYTLFESLYRTNFAILFWVLPGVIGGFAISYFRKKYAGKTSDKKLIDKNLSVSE